MPQIFQVLRCYKCSTFQVHQTKKSNKFSCKICDEKQSIKRHYGIGIAKDCRMHVQKLNKMRGERDETKLEDVSDEYEEANSSNRIEGTLGTTDNVKKTSKWLSYIDKQIEETDDDESTLISETNHNNNNKSWPRNNKHQNYKAKKNISSKRRQCKNIDENDVNDGIENIIDYDNTKNMFGKRHLFENRDDSRVNKISKTTSNQDMKLTRINSEIKDSNQPAFKSVNKTLELKPPEVDKSSKWAQFIEDEEIGEENCDVEAIENIPKTIHPLFSLCDESDIDDVLDI